MYNSFFFFFCFSSSFCSFCVCGRMCGCVCVLSPPPRFPHVCSRSLASSSLPSTAWSSPFLPMYCTLHTSFRYSNNPNKQAEAERRLSFTAVRRCPTDMHTRALFPLTQVHTHTHPLSFFLSLCGYPRAQGICSAFVSKGKAQRDLLFFVCLCVCVLLLFFSTWHLRRQCCPYSPT